MLIRKPSAEQIRELDNPPADVVAKIDRYFSRALAWYDKIEIEYQQQGRCLTQAEQERARRLGVLHPERVRVMALKTFPMPEDPELLKEAKHYGMGSFFEGGRTIGYVIMLKPKLKDKPEVLSHELVHVSQTEHLGHSAFLHRYFVEILMLGYFHSPLEREAYGKQKSVK